MLAAILKMGLATWPSCLQQRPCRGAVALWLRFGKKKKQALKITSKRKSHKAPVIIDQWKLPNVFKCEAFTGRVPLKAPRAPSSFYRWVMICLLLLAVLNRVVNEPRQTRDVTFPDVKSGEHHFTAKNYVYRHSTFQIRSIFWFRPPTIRALHRPQLPEQSHLTFMTN